MPVKYTQSINTPEQLTQVLNGLILTSSEKFDLNRRLANRTRQYFRAQIKAQRDIGGNSYKKRAKIKISLDNNTRKAKNNKNMLLGFGRALKTQVSDKNFQVGLTGVTANMAKVHNDGQSVSFTTRAKGFYNAKSERWEGGVKVKNFYTMPKRTFIGWTPALERELLAMVGTSFLNGAER